MIECVGLAGGQWPDARSLERSSQLPALQQCPSAGAALADVPDECRARAHPSPCLERVATTIGPLPLLTMFCLHRTPMADACTYPHVGLATIDGSAMVNTRPVLILRAGMEQRSRAWACRRCQRSSRRQSRPRGRLRARLGSASGKLSPRSWTSARSACRNEWCRSIH